MRIGVPAFSCASLRQGEALTNIIHKFGHEIGNPLTAIISFATVLERPQAADADSDASNKARSYARMILDESWRITGLSERLVLLLSGRAPVATNCDIEAETRRTLDKITRQKEFAAIDLRLHRPASPITALLDTEQYRVLVGELVRNAFQAVNRSSEKRGGAMAEDPEHNTVSVRIEPGPTQLHLSVINYCATPCPFSLNELFEPFITENKEAKFLGIGLTVAWAIVERMGGSLAVEEEEVESAYRFSTKAMVPILLKEPVKDESAAAVKSFAEPPKSIAPAEETRSFLIIENEAGVASAIEKILSLSLRDQREKVFKVSAGKEALRYLENGERFDVILCDLNLEGTSGRFVYETVLNKWPEQAGRFIFITGDRSKTESQRYLTSTGRPVLYKPFGPKELLQVVQLLLPG